MKKFLSLLVMFFVLTFAVCLTVGCGETPDVKDEVTVSWYRGSELLKEEKVEKGAKVQDWTPEAVEGKEFDGWFKEASLSEPFDFQTAIEEDTDIFAKYSSNVFANDENSYYLIGTGAGDMLKANWDHTNAAANLTMTKQDVENANVYVITLKMYAGDMFQICYGGSWDGQVGIGYVDGAEYCDGVNFIDNNTYTAADKKVAQVKDDQGKVVFIGSDEYNKGFEVWNIKLAEGMDGIYEFTYTTYPNAKDKNLITFKLVEKLEAMTVTHDMHFIGTMNEWSQTYEEGELALVESQDKASWTGFITITEEMYADWTEGNESNPLGVKCAALKIFNAIDNQYYSVDGNNIFLTAGTYAFKYTVEGNKVEYQELKYYVVGTFLDGENAVNYAVKDGVTPALTVVDGVATCDLVAIDVTANGNYSWIADQGKPGVFAFKVVFGCELGIKDWYGQADGDNFYVQAGTYTVSLDIATGAVTYTAK